MFQIRLLRAHPDYSLPLGRRACPVVALTPWMRLFGHTDLTPSSEKIVFELPPRHRQFDRAVFQAQSA